MRRTLPTFYALSACFLSLLATKTHACLIVSPIGQAASITDEAAVLVWNKNAGVEHFIRSANFQTRSSSNDNFGFLVPTPSVPTLSPVEEGLFRNLNWQIATPIDYHTHRKFDFTPFVVSLLRPHELTHSTHISPTVVFSAPLGLEILENTRVGAYNATVLRADNPKALQNWLRKNGYHSDKDTLDWLSPYIANHWAITAFKIAADAKTHSAQTGGVRISFKTPRLFYPYREPLSARQHKTPRSLRVFVLANERMTARIEKKPGQTIVWPGKLTYSSAPDASSQQALTELANLPTSVLRNTRLTVFDDFSAPRPGVGELYFSPDTDQSQLLPTPIVRWREETTSVPTDVLALVIGGLTFIFYWCRKVRPERTANSV